MLTTLTDQQAAAAGYETDAPVSRLTVRGTRIDFCDGPETIRVLGTFTPPQQRNRGQMREAYAKLYAYAAEKGLKVSFRNPQLESIPELKSGWLSPSGILGDDNRVIIGENTYTVKSRYLIDEIFESSVSSRERKRAGDAFRAVGLDGNGRFPSKSAGISAANRALQTADLDLFLDAVSADLLLGDQGSRLLELYRDPKNPTRVENSGLAFSWYRISKAGVKTPEDNYEIVCYLS